MFFLEKQCHTSFLIKIRNFFKENLKSNEPFGEQQRVRGVRYEKLHKWIGRLALNLQQKVNMNTLNTNLIDGNPNAIRKLARAGNIEAQILIGGIYETGNSTMPQDYTKSLYWYTLAAEQGNAHAQNKLGDFYQCGLGTPADVSIAMAWYQKAVEQNDTEAANSLAKLRLYFSETAEDVEKAMQLYLFAAGNGNAAAQYAISEIYFAGEYVVQDIDQALKWLFKAANIGLDMAQHALGARYSTEDMGLAVDYVQSVFWYRKAAEQNHAASQYSLGLKYFYGLGTEREFDQAFTWIHRAAKNGHGTAKEFLESFDFKELAPSNEGYIFYNRQEKLKQLNNPISIIHIANNGEKISETNYFDTDHAKIGECYLSWNAGAARLLVPELLIDSLAEMRTGKKAHIIKYLDAIEIVFDDYTQSPFFLTLATRQCDREIAIAKNCTLFVYSPKGQAFKMRAKVQLSKRPYEEGLPFKSGSGQASAFH